MMEKADGGDRWAMPFLAGLLAGGAGLLLAQAMAPRRRALDPRLIKRHGQDDDIPPVVIVPGIMGSGLMRTDGAHVWLNMHNVIGRFDLRLPYALPLSESVDDLRPGSLLGLDHALPRLFGFTEYYDLLELLEAAGFRPAKETGGKGLVQHVFAYDWRRDLIESVRRLDETLDALADARGDRHTRFNLVGHSMGGLIVRYYLRYGTAEPEEGAPVTWAGAKRIRNVILVATPNGGSIPALDGILTGNRVGLSYTTLSSSVISRMPSVFQLLPPRAVGALLNHKAEPLDLDLHDIETWRRLGWGPFVSGRRREPSDPRDKVEHADFLAAVLARTRQLYQALERPTQTACPVTVILLGGDCLPTLGRCIVPDRPGARPRFEPLNRREADAMFEAGDGRVTRASVLGAHLPGAEDSETGSAYPEVRHSFFGAADHHGIYSEPTFQSVLLRRIVQPAPRVPMVVPGGAAAAAS